MLELSAEISARLARGERFALATVTAVTGSAPRDPGASMIVDPDGRITGSVSGGCVEGAVYELCERVLDGEGVEHGRFGIDDESAFAVGLGCGGEIDVFVQPAAPGLLDREPFDRVLEGESSGIATLVAGPAALLGRVVVPGRNGNDPRDAGSSGRLPGLDDGELAAAGVHGISAARIDAELDRNVRSGRSGLVRLECDGDDLVFFCESRLTPPRMVIFGAVAFAEALSSAAALLGYRVSVCDHRPAFATAERFPAAHEVVAQRPVAYLARLDVDERTVVCVLSHDARTEVPLLRLALSLPVAYVGALGSRRTHEERVELLRAAGATAAELARLRSPIGLDLGAVTPEETAVSILAEVIAVRSGRDARPLSATIGPIHATADREAVVGVS
ncbi:XdhC family protein [Agromyces sp. ISL-38]|uniref:XdhC family protein n=1 Tax=Agromyces sp. ISL-38 TaxID=2819107 RepID=UPI001BED052E|nr:XdhC/CoxI family protein [Agromyces sp. ISL-38]MBT2498132.1 XdhC family protein [Agromyces sp. ISL-38]